MTNKEIATEITECLAYTTYNSFTIVTQILH
jgi:hypothetical protein